MIRLFRIRRLLGILIISIVIVFIFPSPIDIQAVQPIVFYNFIDNANQAAWKSGAGSLPFPGAETDDRGFAMLRQGARMEDGNSYPIVLQTHPQWVDKGWISAGYSQITIPSESNLYIRVGFLDGAKSSDGVVFSVKILEPGKNPIQVVNLTDGYDNKIKETTISLENYVGKTVTFELQVSAGKTSSQDWAAWVDARILQQVLDTDQDNIPDSQDNCPTIPNPNQENQDNDNLGDACDTCDDRDSDNDGIKNCIDQCPSQPETFNNNLDQDGCPDSLVPTLRVSPEPFPDTTINWFEGILEGPLMPGAFEDGDGDGVLNFQDDCPNTPADQIERVFENGCLCMDSDGGSGYRSRLSFGSVSAQYTGGESGCNDHCNPDGRLIECSCNADFEQGLTSADRAIVETTIDCFTLGPLPTEATWACTNGRCIPRSEAIASYCYSSEGTCADGIQNQGETGVDCGGICPQCNTSCTTGTIYAPSDTPCTSIFPTDPHTIELYWTDSWLENPCQLYEICHPDLDYIIQEATSCCSIPRRYSGMTTEESALTEQAAIDAMPEPNLCQAARDLTGDVGGCSRCVGMYIIKGLGDFARWMVGYNSLYPEHNVDGIGASPAESLINNYRTGICRDYSEATATLLRKAGYPQNSVNNFCDGHHCYDVIKMPGDLYWTVIDTTGNAIGIVPGSLPGGYPYCAKLDESSFCFNGNRPDGTPCTGTEIRIADIPTLCQPGVSCSRDLFSTPGWSPPISSIFGCR